MPVLQVRDCPADLYERLRSTAVLEHRSIAQQTVVAVQEHLERRGGGRRVAIARIMGRDPIALPPDLPDAAAVVRELRDAR